MGIESAALLEDVEVFPPGHLLPLLNAELVGDVVEPFDLVQQRGHREVAQFWNEN